MKNIKLLLAICVLFPVLAAAQLDFRYDDDVYKTLYIQDLCSFLEANPKTLLLDVRSPGEFNDKAQNAIYSIGHLKGAMNISIDSIDNKIKSLQSKSENPIVVYCSHSQRSRIVSKKLMESGFTKVWNLNGGMTLLNQASKSDFPCKKEMIVSALPYKNLPADEALALIANTKNMQIFDVRTNAEYDGKDTIQSHNIGRISG
ncbi:MAG TPA: rhodanese-like domain-containing protein, partial [Flavobacterium sp.]|nr:rhodanese-like domain-containing protein [Flavobacterium sp.]